MNMATQSNASAHFLVPKKQSLLGLSICSCSLKSGSSGLNGSNPFSAGAVQVSGVTRKEGDICLSAPATQVLLLFFVSGAIDQRGQHFP